MPACGDITRPTQLSQAAGVPAGVCCSFQCTACVQLLPWRCLLWLQSITFTPAPKAPAPGLGWAGMSWAALGWLSWAGVGWAGWVALGWPAVGWLGGAGLAGLAAAAGPTAVNAAAPDAQVSGQWTHSSAGASSQPLCLRATALQEDGAGPANDSFRAPTAAPLAPAPGRSDPPCLHWSFRVCGSCVLEFGCIPQQLQVGTRCFLAVRAVHILTLCLVCSTPRAACTHLHGAHATSSQLA